MTNTKKVLESDVIGTYTDIVWYLHWSGVILINRYDVTDDICNDITDDKYKGRI